MSVCVRERGGERGRERKREGVGEKENIGNFKAVYFDFLRLLDTKYVITESAQ